MRSYKTTGTVIKSFKIGEADKIITLITRKGKLSAVARGVRRTSSKFGARLEPGNDVEIIVMPRKTLDIITGANICQLRTWLRHDLDKLNTAFSMLEMVDKLSEERQDTRLYDLTSAGLDRLGLETRLEMFLLAFDIKILSMTGFMPHLSACVSCGKRVDLKWLGLSEGGLLCGTCLSGQKVQAADPEAVALIRDLLRVRFDEIDKVRASKAIIEKTEELIWRHIKYHVRADFKTRKGEFA